MSEERFYQLVSRKMASEATVQELKELELLMEENKWFKALYAQLIRESEASSNTDDADASYALHSMKIFLNDEDQASRSSLQQSMSAARPLLWRKRWSVAVAAVLLIVISSLLIPFKKGKTPEVQKINEVVSRTGSKSNLKLPDGTKVWLNAESKLTYGDFSGKTREVVLTGEAFFDVAKDSTRPFIITTDKVSIRVLGTAFNVKSYPLDETIETSLIHGTIELTYVDRPAEKFILHPNEKLIIKRNQNTVSSSLQSVPKIQFSNIIAIKDSLLSETAWIVNKLSFSNETLESISKNLERQFDVNIVFLDEEPKYYTYTGLFEQEDVSKILKVLSISQHFKYEVNDKKIIISK